MRSMLSDAERDALEDIRDNIAASPRHALEDIRDNIARAMRYSSTASTLRLFLPTTRPFTP